MIQSRRGFIAGLGALFVAAPAIVRATSLMPVKAISIGDLLAQRMAAAEAEMIRHITNNLYGDLTRIARSAFLPGLFAQIHFPTPLLRALDLPQDIT